MALDANGLVAPALKALITLLKFLKGRVAKKKYAQIIEEVNREVLQLHPDIPRSRAKLDLLPKTGPLTVEAAMARLNLDRAAVYEEARAKQRRKKAMKKKAFRKKAMKKKV
jgi:hypothetical protein